MKKQAVFLDRDGVINDHVRYVNGPEDLILFPEAGKAITLLNQADYLAFVVTNQGGVGLGYMSLHSLEKIHEKMLFELSRDGAHIDAIKYCPHSPKANCSCRKPSPKMILDLALEYDVDLAESYMVGDRDTDVEAGKKAGTKTIFIGQDKKIHANFQAENLLQAAMWIVNKPNFY